MTKQHYAAVAAIIRDERLGTRGSGLQRVDAIACRLADLYGNASPRFDRARFLAACGVKDAVR